MSEIIYFEKAFELIKGAQNIAITSHIHPDGDAIGSSLAMYHLLSELGKSAAIYINDHIPDCYSILPEVNVIQKTPNEKSVDLLLLLDARINRVGGVCEKFNAPVLNIDHHVSNDKKADFLILNADSSSTCEIIFNFMKCNKIPVTEAISMCLYTGIASDTGFFKFDNATASAMEAAAQLVRYGAKPSLIADAIETKTFADLTLIAKALQTIQLFNDGKIIGVFLDKNLADLELTDALIDMIRFTAGVDVAFLVKYERPNTYRLRMRSRYTDVSKVVNRLGGGGHVHAAGATLHGTLSEVTSQILHEFN